MGRNIIEQGLGLASAVAVVAALHVADGTRPVDPIAPRGQTTTSRTAVLPPREKLDFNTGPQTKVE